MQYTLDLEHYSGPLDALLCLVEEEKLDINLISLAKVTEGFLSHLKELKKEKEIPHQILADFLVVASKLLLIKSKVLIPTLKLEKDEEEDIHGLEIQLRAYKKIKEARLNIKKGWHDLPVSSARELLMAKETLFYPPKSITKEKMYNAFKKAIEEIEKFKPIEHIKREIINLQKKIEETLQKITKIPVDFKKLSKGQSKEDVVVLFLAILHLLKDELINVEQAQPFGEILVAKRQKP